MIASLVRPVWSDVNVSTLYGAFAVVAWVAAFYLGIKLGEAAGRRLARTRFAASRGWSKGLEEALPLFGFLALPIIVVDLSRRAGLTMFSEYPGLVLSLSWAVIVALAAFLLAVIHQKDS